MKTRTKLALKRLLRYAPTPNWKSRYPHLNQLERCKISSICQALLKETGNMVYAGPFSTMRLAPELQLCSDPKVILGSYEEEVHDVINEVISAAPSQIIDIGAAFGYYAVGFALKIPNTTVIAFEGVEDPFWGQLEELAKINGVGHKIVQCGFCTAKTLQEVCLPESVILCDCEGAEEDILQPLLTPVLKSCKILIEIHEFLRPNLESTLIDRFRDSHEIRIIEETERNPSKYRVLNRLPQSWRRVAIEETRFFEGRETQIVTSLRFMVLTPKNGVQEDMQRSL